MKRTTLTHASVLILGSTISGFSLGNGFAINEQSAATLGQAYSGRVSDADDASTLAGNPAGMSRLKQGEFSAGAAYIDARSKISDTSANIAGAIPVSGSNDGNMIPGITVPFGYFVYPINSEWSIGFGVFSPYGLKTNYEDTFQGRYLGVKSDLEIITAQPTVSYRLNDNLSFGLGITYNKIDGQMTRNSSSGTPTDILANVEGNDTEWGYNLGVLYEIDARTRIGVTYYSKVDYTLEGHTQLTNVPGLGNPRFNASLDLTTPDKLDFGLTHDFTPALTLHADITRTNWSELNSLVVKNETPIPTLATDTENFDWNNTWSASIGLSYRLNSQWTVRGGLGLDPSPVDNSTRSVRVPVNDRHQIAVGTTWAPLQNLSVDFGYLYFRESTAHVDITQDHAGVDYSYTATYKNSASIYGLQLNWKI